MGKQRASAVLTRVVVDLSDQLASGVRPALADEPDAVHRLRTVVRRLRGVLAAFDRCFADPAEIRAGLADCSDRLGARRDAEVRAADARRAASTLGLDRGQAVALIPQLDEEGRRAQTALVDWAHGEAARRLVRDLAAWAQRPVFTDAAEDRARHVLRAGVRRERRRVLERSLTLGRADGDRSHEVRQAARRLRHVAETASPFLSGSSRIGVVAVGRLGRQVQGLLGEHRDAVLLAARAEEVELSGVAVWAHRQAAESLLGLPAALLALANEDRI